MFAGRPNPDRFELGYDLAVATEPLDRSAGFAANATG